ncbi:MAG: Fe-S oxidoreductase [archaeon GW2011_AR5]|nr:MAG: Fe-S oxidoreductase [archaeon GW2011_AR5]
MKPLLQMLESIPDMDVEKFSVTTGSEKIVKDFSVSSVKKVLFIIPPTFDFGDFVASSPTNVATIAAYLKNLGYEVNVIDAGVHKIKFEDIVKMTKDYKPDVVAIGCNFSTLHNPSRMLASMIKREYKNIPILVGGNHATAIPEMILKDSAIDFVVLGEAEVVMPDLLSAIENSSDLRKVNGLCINHNGNQVRTHPADFFKNLDELPLPDYTLFDMSKYPLYNINSSRGCIFRCTYCASGVIYKRKYRPRSAKSIVEEISHLSKNFGKKTFWFSDDLFGQDHKFVEELCNSLIDGRHDVQWSVVTRATTVPIDQLKLMKRAGCTGISVGIESGDDEMLKVMKKDTNADAYRMSIPKVKKVIRTRGFFLIGNIGETKKSVWKTFKLIKDVKPDYGTFCPVVPLPGTEIYSQLMSMGIINPETLNWDKFYGIDHEGNYDDESLRLTASWCELSASQIRDYCNYGNMLCLMVALSPVEIFRRMKRDGVRQQFRDDKDKIRRLFKYAMREPRAFCSTLKILATA